MEHLKIHGRWFYPEQRVAVNLQGPLQQFIRALQQPSPRNDSRVVDQYVDVAQLFPHAVSCLIDALALGQIHCVRVLSAAEFSHALGRLLVGLGVAVPQHELGAFSGEL